MAKTKVSTNSVKIDWELVEADYRIGIMSLRQMANEYGCCEGAIRKKAKALKWDRDLNAKVKKRAEDLVRSEEVRTSVRNATPITPTELEKIEISAKIQADKTIEHRTIIGRHSKLVFKLMEELELNTDNKEMFEQLGELLYSPDKNGKDTLNELYMKIISMPSRVDSAKKLSEVLKTLIGLEREAFSIGSAPESGIKLPSSVDSNESWELIIRNIKQDIQKFTIIQQ